jgi:predicted nucleic acid-binding protein
MEQILIDTNAILSFLTDRNVQQKNSVLTLTERSLKGEIELILHQHVISEAIFTLLNVYHVGKKTIVEIVRDLLGHPGVRRKNELQWDDVSDLWSEVFPDVGDAIIAAAARHGSYSVFTFDKKFGKKLKTIGVLWNNRATRHRFTGMGGWLCKRIDGLGEMKPEEI